MARSWQVATAGVIVMSLVGFSAPASALGTPDVAAPTGAARANLIDTIVKKAEPELMQVLVTRRDADGTPTFETVDVDSKADARGVVGRLLGARDVVGVEMNQLVEVAHHKKKCRKFKGKRARYIRCLQRHAHGGPDPLLPQQWALGASYLDFATVSAITAGDTRRPIVAIIDTGVSAGHPDLAGRVIAQVNFVGGPSVADQCGHGTHVAGIVAANANNGIGIAGLSRTALLQSVKVLGASCQGSIDAVAGGITWAVDNGAQVLNLSIEASLPSEALRVAIKYAIDHGRVVVAAAGNGNELCPAGLLGLSPSPCTYPAQYPDVLGVGASTPSNTAAGFSDVGSWVDVAAPGQGILSTYLGNGYLTESGTSMATPYVSALAALLISHCGLSGAAVTGRITGTASHASVRDNSTGYGIIRPQAALAC
jgi:hypothetical protein